MPPWKCELLVASENQNRQFFNWLGVSGGFLVLRLGIEGFSAGNGGILF